MIYAIIYVQAIWLMMLTDALASFACERYFKPLPSFLMALAWPVTIPLTIAMLYRCQKKYGRDAVRLFRTPTLGAQDA